MTTFRRFAAVAALISATAFAPALAAADDHEGRDDRGRYGDRDDRDDHGRYTDRDDRRDLYAPPVAPPGWADRDDLRWSGPGRYDGGWERGGRRWHLLQARTVRHALFELDRERADFYARNGWRPWLVARYDESWFARRAELERRLEWLRATARR
jgi:hypothetical protein